MEKIHRLTITVPGKVILSGEHSVVFGYPAIVIAVKRFLTVSLSWRGKVDHDFFQTLLNQFESTSAIEIVNTINTQVGNHSRVLIKSQIPLGCGMGSSAALASAISLLTLKLSGKPISLKEVNQYAFMLEKHAHQNPSGVDNTIVIFGGILKYQRNHEGIPDFSKLKASTLFEKLLIVNTGKPKETTAEMVWSVADFKQKNPKSVNSILEKISNSTQDIIHTTQSDQDEDMFKQALYENEKALEQLGVVGSSCKKFIEKIENLGGIAKVSGAGGYMHSSGIVLVYPNNNKEILRFIKESGYDYWRLKISKGIRWVKN